MNELGVTSIEEIEARMLLSERAHRRARSRRSSLPERPTCVRPRPSSYSGDLFSANKDDQLARKAPLSARMRPRTLDELVGHEKLLGQGTLAAPGDRGGPALVDRPLGAARYRQDDHRAHHRECHAGALRRGQRGLLRRCRSARRHQGGQRPARDARQRTVLFIDEIHRFNKAQQDAILPYVEDGTVILIGATTENPSFEVNSPLLSRSRVIVLQSLTDADIERIMRIAIADRRTRARATQSVDRADDALESAGQSCQRRRPLRAEHARVRRRRNGRRRRSMSSSMQEAAQRRAATYDKTGEDHYDTISALHKTLARLRPRCRALLAGAHAGTRRRSALCRPSPGALCQRGRRTRRSAGAAAGDGGAAGDPLSRHARRRARTGRAGRLSGACAQRATRSTRAYGAVRQDVESTRNDPVPIHLRNAPTGLMRDLGYGKGYRYAHDYDEGIVAQQNLPDNLAGRRYYQPTDRGFERDLADDDCNACAKSTKRRTTQRSRNERGTVGRAQSGRASACRHHCRASRRMPRGRRSSRWAIPTFSAPQRSKKKFLAG